jgi:nucleoside-diphosphate-sugar epimerase
MNIVLTGSLGHISKPLAEDLIQKGHAVTVISSKAAKQKDIEALGAKAAIGSIEDVAFLTKAFPFSECLLALPLCAARIQHLAGRPTKQKTHSFFCRSDIFNAKF